MNTTIIFNDVLVRVNEEWDFGGHRIFFAHNDKMILSVIDSEIKYYTMVGEDILHEINTIFDGDIDDFIQKYEVQNNE